jgi:hypothetical protein
VFGYDLKQDEDRWRHLCVPAPLPQGLARQARELTCAAVLAVVLASGRPSGRR